MEVPVNSLAERDQRWALARKLSLLARRFFRWE